MFRFPFRKRNKKLFFLSFSPFLSRHTWHFCPWRKCGWIVTTYISHEEGKKGPLYSFIRPHSNNPAKIRGLSQIPRNFVIVTVSLFSCRDKFGLSRKCRSFHCSWKVIALTLTALTLVLSSVIAYFGGKTYTHVNVHEFNQLYGSSLLYSCEFSQHIDDFHFILGAFSPRWRDCRRCGCRAEIGLPADTANIIFFPFGEGQTKRWDHTIRTTAVTILHNPAW